MTLDVESSGTEAIRTKARPTCYLCGSPGQLLYGGMRDRIYDVPGDWALRRCESSKCGLVWLDPCPIDEDIGKLYRSYYTHAANNSRVIRAYRWVCRAVLSAQLGYTPKGRFNRLVGKALSQVGIIREAFEGSCLWQSAQKGRLLDVGCGSGSFLSWMRELGWDVTGVEPDPAGAEVTRQQAIHVRVGTLEDAIFESGEFDLVTLSHVLEHLPDPIRTLAECHRILKPGGKLVAVTPNATSRGSQLYGRNWIAWDSPRHLMVWNVQAIQELARKAGFSKITARTSSRTAWWIKRVSDRLRHHPVVPGALCPFEPWLMPPALVFQFSENLAIHHAPVGEEVLLEAEKATTL